MRDAAQNRVRGLEARLWPTSGSSTNVPGHEKASRRGPASTPYGGASRCFAYPRKTHLPRQLASRFCRNASIPSAASSKSRLHAITSLAAS